MDNDKRLTTGDIMKYCHVSRSTVLKWIKSDKLTAYLHPDGQYRVTQISLVDFLKEYHMPIDEALLEEISELNEDIAESVMEKHKSITNRTKIIDTYFPWIWAI